MIICPQASTQKSSHILKTTQMTINARNVDLALLSDYSRSNKEQFSEMVCEHKPREGNNLVRHTFTVLTC